MTSATRGPETTKRRTLVVISIRAKKDMKKKSGTSDNRTIRRSFEIKKEDKETTDQLNQVCIHICLSVSYRAQI